MGEEEVEDEDLVEDHQAHRRGHREYRPTSRQQDPHKVTLQDITPQETHPTDFTEAHHKYSMEIAPR